eukprot:EG_transcript_17826
MGGPPAEVSEALAALKGRLDQVQATLAQPLRLTEDQEGLLQLRQLLEDKVGREELGKELDRIDLQKVNRSDLEGMLARKVDVQVLCERLAAKANNSAQSFFFEFVSKPPWGCIRRVWASDASGGSGLFGLAEHP